MLILPTVILSCSVGVAAVSDKNGKKRGETAKALSLLTQVAVTIFACVFIGVMLGRYLDGLFGTAPWLLLVFSLMGAGAAFKSLYDLAVKK